MKELDLMVLADRTSAYSRAYLTYLRVSGYRPRKILLIDFTGRAGARRSLARRVPLGVARVLLDGYRALRYRAPRGWASYLDAVQAEQPHRVALTGRFRWRDYGAEVEDVALEGFSDPLLLDVVRASGCRTLLYTGGGLVTRPLLELPSVRVLHVHPGIVPHVRGADGLLWSILTRGRPGYSAFYMNPGIDTGDIVLRQEFPTPQLPGMGRDLEQVYLGVIKGYDTHMRARVLVQVLRLSEEQGVGLDALPALPQEEAEGRTYFFMHPVLRDRVLRHVVS